jgi:hypothetical protein
MSTRTTAKRESVEEQIRQLENQRKQLVQKERAEERKERTHRLCVRGGIVEKLLPELIALTDEQFQIFLNKTLLTDYSKRIIADLRTQGGEAAKPNPAGAKRKDGGNRDLNRSDNAGQSGEISGINAAEAVRGED